MKFNSWKIARNLNINGARNSFNLKEDRKNENLLQLEN